MEITLAISILAVIMTVTNFVLSRKDKAVANTKEMEKENANQQLLDYRLTQVEKKLDKILDKLEDYDTEIDKHIDLAIKRHITMYHGGENK